MSVTTYSDQELFDALEAKWMWLGDDVIQKARNNDGTILNKIGEIYLKEYNYSKALAWYRKAAAQNNSNAQYRIGYMFQLGVIASRNDELAMHWYLKAANNDGNKDAQNIIGGLYYHGLGVTKQIHTAIEWFTKAANQGHNEAQYSLGRVYKDDGEVKDLQKSVNWLKKAADNGYIDAKSALKILNNQGYYPKEEEKVNEQEIKKTAASNSAEGKIKNEVTNSNCAQKQSTSASHSVEHEMESLKEKVKELDNAFQLNTKIIEQERIDDKKKIKEMEETFQSKMSFIEQVIINIKDIKFERQQIEEHLREENSQLRDALSETMDALKDYQVNLSEMEQLQKEKDEEIRILKAKLAHFRVNAKDESDKDGYF